MSSSSSSSTANVPNGWFILLFNDLKTGLEKDILYQNDPRQSISAATHNLEHVIFERFGRLGNPDYGDGYRLKSLFIAAPDAGLQITLSQLVSYIRDLPLSPQPSRPDLFGYGGNKMYVGFQYTDKI